MDITQRYEDSPMSFDMELDVEEDIPAELENFILLVRLGINAEASQILDDILWPHLQQFPVFAEAVGFLLPHLVDTTSGPIRNQAFRLLDASRSIKFDHAEENQLLTILNTVDLEKAKDERVQATTIKSLLPEVDFSLLKSGDYGSIVQLHIFELLSVWASSNHDLYELVAHFFMQHFERLLIENVPREAAQVFAHLCRHYHSARLFGLKNPKITREFLLASYTKMKAQTHANELVHSIASEEGTEMSEDDIDRALTILSLQASMLRNHDVSRAIPLLGEEFSILLSAVFDTQDNQMPHGSFYDVFMTYIYIGHSTVAAPSSQPLADPVQSEGILTKKTLFEPSSRTDRQAPSRRISQTNRDDEAIEIARKQGDHPSKTTTNDPPTHFDFSRSLKLAPTHASVSLQNRKPRYDFGEALKKATETAKRPPDVGTRPSSAAPSSARQHSNVYGADKPWRTANLYGDVVIKDDTPLMQGNIVGVGSSFYNTSASDRPHIRHGFRPITVGGDSRAYIGHSYGDVSASNFRTTRPSGDEDVIGWDAEDMLRTQGAIRHGVGLRPGQQYKPVVTPEDTTEDRSQWEAGGIALHRDTTAY